MTRGFSIGLLLLPVCVQASMADTAKDDHMPVKLSGYLEAYYCYDFGNPADHLRPSFFYNYNRHNEVNLNLGFVKAAYQAARTRANLALMTGTYARYNLASEHPLVRHIFEANAGYRLLRHRELWLDAGIMPSHIGFESAVGGDCWNLTRSILAENSPYYEAGVKLGYINRKESIYMAVMYLNGWQRISRAYNNHTPAFGTQFTWKPDSSITFNWSTYVGNEQPDSIAKWRCFNNFYGIFRLGRRFDLTLGFDIGVQQVKRGISILEHSDGWYSYVGILRYRVNKRIRIALRGEKYVDRAHVIVNFTAPQGFAVYGGSVNLDYSIGQHFLWRLEGRQLYASSAIFTQDNRPTRLNFFATTAIIARF